MIMIRAIVRPEKVEGILVQLADAGFPAVTKMDVVGRGRQRGLQCGDILYDELPKEMLLIICEDQNRQKIIDIIVQNARTGENGNFGDGKIFISPVEEAYTISSGVNQL
jgi:Nitrogen regulatory protein PII